MGAPRMDMYSVAILIFLVFSVLWAVTIIFLWATRPIASVSLFVRALAYVGVVIVCALAGMSTASEAGGNIPAWRIVFAGGGLLAAAAAAHQTYRLMTERKFDFRDPGARGPGRRR